MHVANTTIRFSLVLLLIGCALITVSAQTELPVEPARTSDIRVPIPPPVTVDDGDEVPPPRAASTPDPKMPAAGIKGTVVLTCIVGIDGRVRDPNVIQSLSRQNDAAAIRAVKKWRFVPTKKNGRNVAVRTALVVVF